MTQAQAQAGSMPTDGRWNRYRDHEGNEFQRVSTLIKKVETDRWHLDQWMKRQVLVGAGRRDDLVLAVKSMRPDPVYGWTDRQKQEINKLVEKAEEAAKDLDGAITGTAVHTLTERLDRGESLDSVIRGLPAQAEADLRAYEALIRLNDWQVIEIERTVVNDDLSVAGTFDRVYVIPGLSALLGPGDCQYRHGDHGPGGPMGELAVTGDVKTEKDPLKNGLHIGPQLAIYSRARRMWLPMAAQVGSSATYVSAPCVRQDVAVVVHVRNGHAVPMFVNLTDGWEAALAAKEQAGREKQAKMWLVPMPNIKEPAPAEILTATAVSRQYADPNRPGPGQALPALTMPIPEYKVGDTVTVDGVQFTKHAELPSMTIPAGTAVYADSMNPGIHPWHTDVNTACGNCASLVASATRVDGTYSDETCHQCGKTAIPARIDHGGTGEATAPEEVAAQHPDGMVTWERVGATTGLDDVDKQAIETIWAATALDDLARVYEIYTQTVGRQWGGRVEEAANARRRQIECPQRALHVPGQGGRCACGWTKDVPA